MRLKTPANFQIYSLGDNRVSVEFGCIAYKSSLSFDLTDDQTRSKTGIICENTPGKLCETLN